MKTLQNNQGFTLIELLVTVAIISIGIGLTSYGISIVMKTRVDAVAEQFQTDVRELRIKTLSSYRTSGNIVWDTSQYVITYNSNGNISSETVEIPSDIVVEKDGASIASGTTIEFDSADGSLQSSTSDGEYRFYSSSSGKDVTVTITELGGVFLDE